MNFLRRHDLAQDMIFESNKNPSLKKVKKTFSDHLTIYQRNEKLKLDVIVAPQVIEILWYC